MNTLTISHPSIFVVLNVVAALRGIGLTLVNVWHTSNQDEVVFNAEFSTTNVQQALDTLKTTTDALQVAVEQQQAIP